MMKNIILILFIIISSHSKAQIDTSYIQEVITQEDLIAALRFTGVSIYNFKFDLLEENKCHLLFTLQEYIGATMVNEKELVSMTTPYNAFENHVKVQKDLERIRILVRKRDMDTSALSFDVEIFGGKTSYRFNTLLNPSFSASFGSKPFKLTSQKINSYHPLVMIGSYWKDENDLLRFCMENVLEEDYSSEAFAVMPSYFLIGYRLSDKK